MMELTDKTKKNALDDLKDFNYYELEDVQSKMQATYQDGLKTLLKEMRKTADDWDNASYSQRMDFERHRQLAYMVADICEGTYKANNNDLTAHLRDMSNENYTGNMFAAEQAEGIELSNVFLDTDQVNSMVNKEINGKNFSQRLYSDTNKLAKNTTQAILDGLWSGKGADHTANRIKELYGTSYNNSIRIARTESGRVAAESTQKSYEDMTEQGVDMQKRWSATLSFRTRADHAQLDGQTVAVDEPFKIRDHKAMYPHGFHVPGEDINCRCSTISVINGVEPSLRRDQESRETIQYMNYQDWIKYKQTGKLPAKKGPIDPLDKSQWPKTVKGVKVDNGDYAINYRMGSRDMGYMTLERLGDMGSKEEFVKGFGWAGKEEALKSYKWYRSVQQYAKNNPANKRLDVPKVLNHEEALKELDKIKKLKPDSMTDQEKVTKLQGVINGIDVKSAKHTDIIKLGNVVNNYFDVVGMFKNQEKLSDLISNFRPVGKTINNSYFKKGSHKASIQEIQETFKFLPEDWGDYITNSNLTISSRGVSRAYFSGDEKNIIMNTEKGRKTALHEVGHFVEYFNPEALRISKEWLSVRTKGLEEEYLNDMYPIRLFDNNEMAIRDNFIDAYIGKTYKNASEVLSMGIDGLFYGKHYSRPHKKLSDISQATNILYDQEYLELIIGMLLKV